jgi:predicted phosphoribosyltransferase
MLFTDRCDAGRALAGKLGGYAHRPDVIVLALPRGGVPVALEVAQALEAPLDVFLVRKLGFPGNEEFAMGAIASGGVRVLNEPVLARFGVPMATVESVAAEEQRELRRRERTYRGDLPALDVRSRTVIVVDDGLATGFSMRAAVTALRSLGPQRIVVAVPVGPADTVDELRRLADEVVCVATPEPFLSVGRFYDIFDQTSDAEVQDILARARRPEPAAAGAVRGNS